MHVTRIRLEGTVSQNYVLGVSFHAEHAMFIYCMVTDISLFKN